MDKQPTHTKISSIMEILSSNPLIGVWLFHVSVLSLKMLAMSMLTARQRMKNKAFANPEDASMQKLKPKVDENVERVRRAHLNDLENIPVFFVVSLAYIMTNPAVGMTKMLFRIVTATRFLHTFVYAVVVIPQPARALAFFGTYFTTIYMAVQTIIHFSGYM